jgi:hypothetical protein
MKLKKEKIIKGKKLTKKNTTCQLSTLNHSQLLQEGMQRSSTRFFNE